MKNILSLSVLWTIILFSATSQAQNHATINSSIKGKVIDAKTNEILIGASVSIKGITNGATTDANGEFTILTAQKLPFTLVISYVGYVKKELLIDQTELQISLEEDSNLLNDVVVSSRRRQESVQEVPIPISVIRGVTAEDAGAFNPNRLKELVPSVQLYSSNGRNTTLNIRGLGSSFGLTNDGLDQGVGFYVDGVYYARPAATVIDFVDVERVEVLRGPQGTLYGKNTTAGAFNITTRAPSFSPSASFETSYGNFNFIQTKASVTGPLSDKLAARLSFSGTQRGGTIYQLRSQKYINTLNNLGFRGQLLYSPNSQVNVTLAVDNARQRPDGMATVLAGVVKTQRPAYRQFDAIISDLGYRIPSKSGSDASQIPNAFDRITDTDSPWKVNNDFGGSSLNIDAKVGNGRLSSTTAWRYWKWDPANDRDFLGLPVFTKSQGNSKHRQLSQELRYAGKLSESLSGVIGAFFIQQQLDSDPYQIEESGAAAWRFAQSSNSALWKTPGLFDGFGTKTTSSLQSTSAAIFGQADWALGEKLHLLPGLRFNYDKKEVDYLRETYGGLQTSDPALLALKNSVYTNQAFNVDVDENNISGQLTLLYKAGKRANAFATYAKSFKPVGVNLGGLPTSGNRVLTELAIVKPEKVQHIELGLKTQPSTQSTLNVTLFDTQIKDYQTQVQTAEVGVNRGYLANAEKVRVYGTELEASLRLDNSWSFNTALSYTIAQYLSFKNAPVPLEEVGGSTAFKDISGGSLPGVSKWVGSLSSEYSTGGKLLSLKGRYFLAGETYFRSGISSSPSPSKYLNIEGYALLNARIGFRAYNGFSVLLWSRNLTNKNYYEQLLPAAGSTGHYGAVLGDPRTYGTTLRYVF